MKRLYCAGDQGRVALDIIRAESEGVEVSFVDDDTTLHDELVEDVQVVGAFSDVDVPSTDEWLITNGHQNQRLELADRVSNAGGDFFNAVHPACSISPAADLNTGVTINAESYVGPGVVVENHVLIDSCVNISHDVTLGRGATVTPNATLAGDVDLGMDAYIGPGATVLRGRDVGDQAVVGAGAVVTDDVPSDTTVMGVPATRKEE